MCQTLRFAHTDSKNVFVSRLIFEVVVQSWTFTISLPIFLFNDLLFWLLSYLNLIQQKMLRALSTPIIYSINKEKASKKLKNPHKKHYYSIKLKNQPDSSTNYKFFLSLACLNPLRILIQALIHAIWGRFYFAIFPLRVYIMRITQ